MCAGDVREECGAHLKLMPLGAASTLPIDTTCPNVAAWAMYVCPSVFGPEGGTSDASFVLTFGTEGVGRAVLPARRGLPRAVSCPVTDVFRLFETKLPPGRGGTVAEFFVSEFDVVLDPFGALFADDFGAFDP